MKILANLIVFILTLIFTIIGGLLIAFSFNLFAVENVTSFLYQTFDMQNLHLIIGLTGFFLIIASIFIAQLTLGNRQREKTIAFNNPEGQVTVSLSAIEDFIRRLATNMIEIKDLRNNVVAGKKGIEINARVSLWSDVNIPQATGNIQIMIKNRIQEMLGIEEPIIVRMHVGKIVQKEKRRPKKKGKEKDELEQRPPFQGNIEYGKD